MSIATAIQNAQSKIAAAYAKCSDKGATMPATQDLAHLAACIDSIPTGPQPLYDAMIEYIQSTGAQYINLDILPNNNTGVIIDALWTGTTNTELVGARGNTSSMYEFLYESNRIYYQYGNVSPYTASFTITSRNVYESAANVFSINGVTKITATASTFNTPVSLTLCALNNNGHIERFAKAKIYSVKVIQGGVTVRNMIPVRVGQVGYLYDSVSDSLFGNDGSGVFTLGPDL